MSTKWEMNPPGRVRGEAWGLGIPTPRLPSSPRKLGGWETGRGDGGKGGCVAKTTMTHEAEMDQMLWQAFDKVFQLGRDLDFLKVSSPLNFKAFGRGFDQVGNHSSSSRQAQQGVWQPGPASQLKSAPSLRPVGGDWLPPLLATITAHIRFLAVSPMPLTKLTWQCFKLVAVRVYISLCLCSALFFYQQRL